MKLIDLTNKDFDHLTVLGRSDLPSDKWGNVKWKCLCVCGKIVHVTSLSLRTRNTKSCGCKQYSDRSMLYGNKAGTWTGYKDLPGSKWKTILRQAKQRGIFVDVTIEQIWQRFVKQGRKCALSGEELFFDLPGKKSSGTASLDRVDYKKGYTTDNIQWVHKDVNMMKWKLTQNRFLQLCKKITQNSQQ